MRAANSRIVPLLLFLAAFCAIALQFPAGRMGPGYEPIEIAHTLATRGEFANPYAAAPTGLTAHTPPLYPMFLAFLIWIFGYTQTFRLVAALCSMLAQAFHAALLPYVSELWFGNRWPGILGAVFGILFPVFFFFPHSESIYAATGLMLFCLASSRLMRRGGTGAAVLCGVFLGTLTLLNPAVVIPGALWLGYLFWRRRPPAPVRFALIAGLGCALALAPWTWRNYRVFHTVFLVRDNLGGELFMSNNDLAGPDVGWNLTHGVHAALHPGSNRQQAEAVRSMGEIRYNRERMHQALDWIRHHPARFFALTLNRIRLFWFPGPEDGGPAHTWAIAFLTVASVFSLALMAIRRQAIALYAAAVLSLYPLMYYLVMADPRYRAPILWVLLLNTGYLLFAAVPRWAPGRAA